MPLDSTGCTGITWLYMSYHRANSLEVKSQSGYSEVMLALISWKKTDTDINKRFQLRCWERATSFKLFQLKRSVVQETAPATTWSAWAFRIRHADLLESNKPDVLSSVTSVKMAPLVSGFAKTFLSTATQYFVESIWNRKHFSFCLFDVFIYYKPLHVPRAWFVPSLQPDVTKDQTEAYGLN